MYPPVTQFETRKRQAEEHAAEIISRLNARAREREIEGRPRWYSRLVRGRKPLGSLTLHVEGDTGPLPRSERRALERLTGTVEFPAGKRLVTQGKLADSFFVIESGRAAVIQNDSEIGELGPGDFFGEIALLHQRPRTASVIATTDLRARVIPQLDFTQAIRTFPTFARILRASSSRRLRTA